MHESETEMARTSEAYELARGFGLLSDATRLGILKMLTTGPKNVTALCKGLRAKQPMVSHHLGLLRMGRLVIGTRKGKSMIYVCDAAAMKTLAVGIARLSPRK
jgi:ArsR family transcriptional regulator